MPEAGDSAAETARGMTASNTRNAPPNCSRTVRSISLARLFRPSYSVTSIPSTASEGLIWRLTRPTDFKSPVMAEAGRNSADAGMSTPSTTAKAFTGIIPSVAGQSTKM